MVNKLAAAYAFDLKLVCGGYGYFSTYTLGSAPGPLGLEVRTPSEINSEGFADALKELGQDYMLVSNDQTFYDWTCIQGWAIAELGFVRAHMAHWLKSRECLVSPYGSFTDVGLASQSIRKRTFRGKFKKRILDRDNNRCVICQKTESLTLQHVRPYSKGGETSFRNLVTLCESCNQIMGADSCRELYRLAGLRSSCEPVLLKGSNYDDRAFHRAVQFSSNIMHTRCELY